MKVKYLFFLLILLLQGCPAIDLPPKFINVYNKTDSTIFVAYSFNDTLDLLRPLNFSDTIYWQGHFEYYEPRYKIEANKQGSIDTCGRRQLLENIPDKRIRLFFIRESILNKYSWAEICKNQLFDTKITLTVSDLEKCKWKIVYKKP
ncbi:MAG: hypothetical protein QM751_03480 [Paludibacteraceae bacterium]